MRMAFSNLVLELVHVVFGRWRRFSPRPVDGAAGLFAVARGIVEVAGDGFFDLLAGVQQPEDDEERHHGGDEVGVGDLPRAAVMAAVADFFLDDDDGLWASLADIAVRLYAAAASAAAAAGAAAALQAVFHLVEGGADVPGNGAAADLDGEDGGDAFEEGDDDDAQDVIVGVLVVGVFGHVGGDGADEAVAQQDAEEGADERGGDFVADLLRRAAERAHGDDDAEHGGDDAEAGQRVGRRCESAATGCAGLVVVDFHVEFHHLVHVEGLDAAGDGDAQGVADEVQRVVVLEEVRVFREDRRFRRACRCRLSTPTRPSLRALLKSSYIIFRVSR